jgi:WD40 repeat protein
MNVINYLNGFFPNDISKIITKYAHYFEGKSITLKGHTEEITCITILPDGKIVSGSYKGIIKIWSNGVCEATLKDDCNIAIIFLDMLPDGPLGEPGRLVSGTSQSIKIWNLRTGDCENTFRRYNIKWICCTHVRGGMIIIITLNFGRGTLLVLDPRTGLIDPIRGLGYTPLYCNTLSDGKINIGCEDFPSIIYDVEYNTYVVQTDSVQNKTFGLHSNIFSSHFDGQIIIALENKTIKLWNRKSGKIMLSPRKCDISFNGHSEYIRCIAILPDKRIITGSEDKTLKIWNHIYDLSNASKPECEMTLVGHSNYVSYVAILPDGKIVSGSADNTLKIWS